MQKKETLLDVEAACSFEVHLHVFEGGASLGQDQLLLRVEPVAESVTSAGTAQKDYCLFVADEVNPVLYKLVGARWLQRNWISHHVFQVDFKLDAKWKLSDGMVVGPVEPLARPLIDLLVNAVAVEAVVLELVVERSVPGAVGILDLVVINDFVYEVFQCDSLESF